MSTLFYDGKYSIIINGKHTWEDWHLAPTSRTYVVPPEPRYSYLEIPGMNGELDLTEALTNDVFYGMREGSWEFYVDNNKGITWYELYSSIMNEIHGQKVKVILTEDPNWYYEGRVAVDDWSHEKDASKITFNYKLDPYKYSTYGTLGDWLWDPFNFNTDYCYDWRELNVTGKRELNFYWPGQTVSPVISVSNAPKGISFTFSNDKVKNKAVKLSNGSFKSPLLTIKHGQNKILAEAWTGTFSISTRDSRL